MATSSGKKKRRSVREELAELTDMDRARGEAMANMRRQLRTAAKVVIIALVVIWAICIGLWSGLNSTIPLIVGAVFTVAAGVGAALVKRNLGKSEELGELLGDSSELSAEERAARIGKLEDKVAKGDATAIIAKAQLQMQDAPRDALTTLEGANLEKAQKVIANQIRGMRAMIHLNLSEVKAARELADAIDLAKSPDLKSRANLSGVVAEAWARSGNPIEATELLDKYNPDDKDFQDVKMQLWRARAFAAAHKNDMTTMKKAVKALEEMSPQLLAIFVGQKRVHPLLQQEAKKKLEKSGLVPKPRIQAARR